MPEEMRIEFLGPLDIYVRPEEGKWLAAIDPFSVFGEGRTKINAIREALDDLVHQLMVVAEEMAEHRDDGINVQLLCPLTEDYKSGAKKTHEGFIVAAYAVQRTKSRPAPRRRRAIRKLTKKTFREILKHKPTLKVFEPELEYAETAAC